tara:strand:- start:507 stop:713 length:207 start_codon:yes stop_codon:yes gene_type:complete
MKIIQLTPDNSKNYIGYQCVYNHGKGRKKKKYMATITRTSPSGKTIYIDDSYHWNALQIVSRKVFVFV